MITYCVGCKHQISIERVPSNYCPNCGTEFATNPALELSGTKLPQGLFLIDQLTPAQKLEVACCCLEMTITFSTDESYTQIFNAALNYAFNVMSVSQSLSEVHEICARMQLILKVPSPRNW